MIPADAVSRIEALLRAATNVVLTTHVNPDGDAIGSELGMAGLLRSRGKVVRIVNHDETPKFLKFLEDPRMVMEVYDPARHDDVLASADLVVLLDNSAPDRLGRMEAAVLRAADHVLCIDHHPTKGTPWAHNVLDEEACATSAIVAELVGGLGFTPDRVAAQALYVGLATDTGFFRFNSTTPRAHRMAADLLALGADPARCYQEVYERNPPAHTRLLGHALADLRLESDGAVASIRITRELAERCQAAHVDTSEMTTALLATDGVRVALLFREMGEGRVKVSLRSKGELDVHRLASRFGGGGHRNASGIVRAGALSTVEEEVVASACDLVAGRL